MSKIRVHELAKELNISSKTIIETLKKGGVEVSSHMSTLDDSAVNTVKNSMGGKKPAAPVKQAEQMKPAPIKPAVSSRPEETGKPAPTAQTGDRRPAAQQSGGQKPVNRAPQGTQSRPNNQGGQSRPNNQSQGQNRNGQGSGQNRSNYQGQSQQQRSTGGAQGTQQNRSNNGTQQGTQNRSNNGTQQGTQQNRNNTQGNRAPYNNQQGNRPQGQQNRNQFSKPQGQQNNNTMRAQNKPAGTSQGQRPDNRGTSGTGGNTNNTGSNTRTKTFNNNSNNRSNQGRGNNQGGYKPAGGYNNNYRNNNNNRGKKPGPKPVPVKAPEPVEEELKIIQIPASLSIKELAMAMRKSGSEVVKMLFKKGQMININSTIEFDTAAEIAEEYNIMVELEVEKDIFEEAFKDEPEDEKNLVKRPPVVVVMGHVDHGKTSLLDAIRKSKVTQGEAGGITQHIGAYTVDVDGNPITFLDTPGHEAFTAMRMRGAQITDIAVLVVAADDGVMPQTVEAINHAKAAGVEIIVAVNKIDKVGANPDRVKQELTEHGILTEDWGGETICVPVSALNKTGIDNLLEMIILASEVKELKANPKKKARGTVIEAQLDKGRGPVATILVQNGTLSVGDPIVAGSAYGKIRAMMDDKGRRVKKAGPSIPVEILGLNEVPSAGDAFYIADNEKHARTVAETVVAKTRTEMIKSTPQKVSLDDLFTQIQSGNMKELNVVVKADVQGSVEAVKQSLEKLSNEEVRVRIIHGGVGTITESDVMLASASNAIIIGFNVRPETMAKTFAETEKVDIRLYRVIYNAIEDVMNAMKGMLDPVFEEKIIGHAVVRQLFKASGVGVIAGSYVTDGKFQRGCSVRVFRGSEKIHEGELDSLKRFKDDVKEVATNYECGLVIKKFSDLQVDDTVEAYIMVEVPR